MLIHEQAPMYVKDLSPDTSFLFDAENGLIKLSQWSSGLEEMAIDITVDDVKRFTNCKEVSEGMALLEFACQVFARSLYRSCNFLFGN